MSMNNPAALSALGAGGFGGTGGVNPAAFGPAAASMMAAGVNPDISSADEI